MGLGLGFGAFVGGASDGYDKSRQRAMQDEKMSWERADQKEKADMRIARDDLSKSLQSINTDSAYGKLPGAEDNVVPQQADAQQTQPQTAIAGPDQAAAGAATPAATPQVDRLKNPFTQNGEGLYKNQQLADDAKYKATRDAMANYFVKIGQPEKVLTLDKAVNEMREAAYDPVRKHALAAISSGSVGAMDMATKFSQAAGLGYTYEGGQYDAKTHAWNGVKVTDANGKSAVENIPVATFGTVMGGLTFDKALQLRFDREDAAAKNAIESKKADASMITAGAHARNAATNESTRASNEGINNEVRSRRYFDDFYGAGKDFQVKEPKDMLGWDDKQKSDYAAKVQNYETGRHNSQLAGSIFSINPGVKPGEITALIGKLSKNPDMKPDGQDSNGSYYFNVGGKKIVMPSN